MSFGELKKDLTDPASRHDALGELVEVVDAVFEDNQDRQEVYGFITDLKTIEFVRFQRRSANFGFDAWEFEFSHPMEFLASEMKGDEIHFHVADTKGLSFFLYCLMELRCGWKADLSKPSVSAIQVSQADEQDYIPPVQFTDVVELRRGEPNQACIYSMRQRRADGTSANRCVVKLFPRNSSENGSTRLDRELAICRQIKATDQVIRSLCAPMISIGCSVEKQKHRVSVMVGTMTPYGIAVDDCRDKLFSLVTDFVDRLAAAHSIGFIHGDIKPSNLVVLSNSVEEEFRTGRTVRSRPGPIRSTLSAARLHTPTVDGRLFGGMSSPEKNGANSRMVHDDQSAVDISAKELDCKIYCIDLETASFPSHPPEAAISGTEAFWSVRRLRVLERAGFARAKTFPSSWDLRIRKEFMCTREDEFESMFYTILSVASSSGEPPIFHPNRSICIALKMRLLNDEAWFRMWLTTENVEPELGQYLSGLRATVYRNQCQYAAKCLHSSIGMSDCDHEHRR